MMSAVPSSLLAGRKVVGPASARLTIDGREYLNFYGSGYLALSNVPEIRAAAAGVLESGAPFARHIPGGLGAVDETFAEVERAGARACGTPASVYFTSGYLIGAVGLQAIDSLFDVLLLDETAHYNLKEAATLSTLPMFTFAHCDADSLRQALQRHVRSAQRPLVITDGVYATTGRVPPLAAYAESLATYDGRLFIDEAHAFGVIGDQGRGAAEFCGVEHLIAVTGTTLSKAYCAQGALVGCSREAAVRVQMQAPVRGACAGSPISAAVATASLTYVEKHPEVRAQLRALTDYFRARLRGLGLEVLESPAPIVSFQWGQRADMQELQQRLFNRGIFIYHSTYLGASPEGVIRCAVFRDHTRADIDALVDALK
jgi:7-keto-8-aminopelargonate synthetase-like enzyme